ncbi:hypothetical protein CCACVL1_02712 [Corchorus capsularis]|uniref:Uncharacterized protein n=1 Tax=Corchorus capsularis TaxID=210143 RepID=A0A1R3K1I1_COCAP|nr:hypothetical protein CCACVL1_03286 [Corchorus capsularis]OMP02735.1 hypothetical protein CCACVL1_02712 [Corchorus capsularis]
MDSLSYSLNQLRYLAGIGSDPIALVESTVNAEAKERRIPKRNKVSARHNTPYGVLPSQCPVKQGKADARADWGPSMLSDDANILEEFSTANETVGGLIKIKKASTQKTASSSQDLATLKLN